MAIEVRWTGRGVVRGDEVLVDTGTSAACTGCSATGEPVASVAPEVMLCSSCLRLRLDALSVARYRLKEDGGRGIPWGRNAG